MELQVPLFLHPVEPVLPARVSKYYLHALTYYLYDTTATVGAMLLAASWTAFQTCNSSCHTVVVFPLPRRAF